MTRRFRIFSCVLTACVALSGAPAQDAPAGTNGTPSAPEIGAAKPFPFPYVFPRPSVEELNARRAKLADAIGDGAVVMVSQEGPSLSSGSRYKPGHNIYYFTGVDTDFCAFILVAKAKKISRAVLFLPKYDAFYELWNGKRIVADDEAKAVTGVDEIVKVQGSLFGASIKPFQTALEEVARSSPGVIFTDGSPPERGAGERGKSGLSLATRSREDALRAFIENLDPKPKVRGLGEVVGRIRAIKSPYEIEMLRQAARVTGEGFLKGMRASRPGMWEFEFQAFMDHAFADFGCTGAPYYPITASGPNACILHYNQNRRRFEDGDLVLCDIAAEYGYYAADVTRTFPANGKFTPEQKQIYEAVLAAMKPGVDYGALDEQARAAMRARGAKEHAFYPHGLGHHVGLDVHDVGGNILKPGMVWTIEPGYYDRQTGVGVRIEDMYLVTETGAVCLSATIPRDPTALEAIVGAAHR